jgi:PPOX class probable F420-dependent enzyme
VLVTVGPDGTPRPVPICFAVAADPPVTAGDPGHRGTRSLVVLYSPVDEKPKRTGDPRGLARVRDILVRPAVTVLVDRWVEDWSRLAWLRMQGTARLLEPADRDAAEHERAVTALRARYSQYAKQALEARPMLRIEVTRVIAWGDPGGHDAVRRSRSKCR